MLMIAVGHNRGGGKEKGMLLTMVFCLEWRMGGPKNGKTIRIKFYRGNAIRSPKFGDLPFEGATLAARAHA